MSGNKDEPDDLHNVTSKMDELYISKGAIPKKMKKTISIKEGKKRCATEEAPTSSNMSSEDLFQNSVSDISVHKSEKYNSTGIKKVKPDVMDDFGKKNQNVTNDVLSCGVMVSPKEEGYIHISGNKEINNNKNSKEIMNKQNNTDMMLKGYNIFDRNLKRKEKNGNEMKSTKIRNNQRKGQKKIKGNKLKDNFIKMEMESPETDVARFQYLSYADTVRYGVKRDTNDNYMCANNSSDEENSPKSLMEQPSTSTTKVGNNLQHKIDELQEVPNMCSTTNNINSHSESKTRKELFPNIRENSTIHIPFSNNNQYHQNNTDMISQLEHGQSFAEFCQKFCNVFTVITQGRNLLMMQGSVSLQVDPVDIEKEKATITEIFDLPEGDKNPENPVADASKNTAHKEVQGEQIILEEARNYAEDESNNSASGVNVNLPVNSSGYQEKYDQIFIKPNSLINKMACIPGTWSLSPGTGSNSNMWVLNGKPMEHTMTVINCNYATLSLIRLPIIPQFDARNMILVTSSVGDDITIIPKTIFTVTSPPVGYNAIGAWYLIFNNPNFLNATCAGEWFWSPYQFGVRDVVFYWIPHCTSQFMNEGIDSVWMWFPTHPAAKKKTKYIIPHVLMKNSEKSSCNGNRTNDVNYIAINPTTRSNLVSVPVLAAVRRCDNSNEQNSNHNEHMDETKGFFPLSFKLPPNIS